MSANDIIKIACWRIGSWEAISSEELAARITAAWTVPEGLTLDDVFTAIVGAAAEQNRETVKDEMAQLWKYGEFLRGAKNNLESRNLVGLATMLDAAGRIKENGTNIWSEVTINAASAALATMSLRLIDVVAAERGEEPPETVTSVEVVAALGRE